MNTQTALDIAEHITAILMGLSLCTMMISAVVRDWRGPR